MIDLDAVAKKLDRRDGFRVVAHREVGLPVFRLSSVVTLQETTALGPIEEYMLRSISQGVDNVPDLQRFLGLPYKIVVTQLGRLVFEGVVAQRSLEPIRYSITLNGTRRLATASSSALVRERMPLYVDGITRRLVPVDTRDLWTGSQLDPIGVSYVTPTPRSTPRATDIDVGDINRVLMLMAKSDGSSKRVVRLDALVGKANLLFRRAQAIAFKSTDGKRMSIAFAIDGRQSEEHEVDYERSGAAQKSSLFGMLFDADKRRREVRAVARELRDDIETGPTSGRHRPVLSLKKDRVAVVQATHIRVLSVYEHPPLLRGALEDARNRLLIVSPWIRANVVDKDFMKLLTSCLARGVDVAIGYGIGKRDLAEKDPDRRARESLESLAKSFPNFRLVRKGNTHAKVLLVDDRFFVTTSFNWLSFRGDPSQPMREEEGTMVEDAIAVDAYYQKLIERMPSVGG
jgi:hypothetical protein